MKLFAHGNAENYFDSTRENKRSNFLANNKASEMFFVKKHCKPIVSGFSFLGAKKAFPNDEFMMALKNPTLKAVIICPSNPFISIDPILAVNGVRKGLRDCRAPVIAVSQIIADSGIKGPIAKQLK